MKDFGFWIPGHPTCIVLRTGDQSIHGLSKEGPGVDSTVLHAIQTMVEEASRDDLTLFF